MKLDRIIFSILGIVVWGGIFFFTLNYIGKQWEYEGLISRGLIAGISLRSTEHVLYSIATVAASAFVATMPLLLLAMLFKKNKTGKQKGVLVFSSVSIVVITAAFFWNRHQIELSKQPIAYRHYDSTGKLLEPEKHTANLKNSNVILISIDTLNPLHLGCYGYDRNTSPTIDSLAQAGAFFENAFSQSPKTSPAHMTLFTSLYPSVHKIRNWNAFEGGYALDHRIITFTEILKNVGYTTAAFTGGGNVRNTIGFGDGFDVYDNDDQVWDRAFDWLDQNHDEQFFLFLHTFKVHSPYLPPPPYNTMFDEDYSGKMVDSEEGLHRVYDEYFEPDDPFPGSHNLFWHVVDKEDPRDIEHLIALYDGCIRFMNDVMMGTLINKMRKYDLLDNTLLIFTSDHGEEFLQHGDFLHKELYDEHIRIPLIMNFPGDHPYNGQSIRQQVSLVDLMPTLLDYLALPVPVMTQGTILTTTLEGKPIDLPVFSERIVISDLPDMKKAMRTLDWKYIWWKNTQKKELFDLISDPLEQKNVAATNPDVIKQMHSQLSEWMQVNSEQGQSIRTYTHTFSEKDIEKLRSLGYIK